MAAPETALITGASAGIGTELARCFARDGSDVVLLARREPVLRRLADELEAAHGITAHVLPADLSDPRAPETVATNLKVQGIAVDVLVNNAGFGARGPFADLDAARQVDMVQVNVTALMQLARLLLPEMLHRNRGGILNVASTAAFQPGPYMSVYYASKAFVLSFSEGLAEEVADTNVTVTCLAPGPTETEFFDRANMEDMKLSENGIAMSADAVARTGYAAFRNGAVLTIPGTSNQVGAFLTRFLPRALVRKFAAWLQQ
jgi:hypothetical protein